jgi:hypothetical protein
MSETNRNEHKKRPKVHSVKRQIRRKIVILATHVAELIEIEFNFYSSWKNKIGCLNLVIKKKRKALF